MNSLKSPRAILMIAGVAAVGLVVLWWMTRKPHRSDDDPALFREAAMESGITFKTNFLPGEQGESFKVNLYDHGSGVAVGDYDGDGHDDIYLVNQLGPNALYRNKGDGTFEEVTKEAGVGLGDRICVGAVFADTRNNGRQDLFVTSVRGGNVFFRNEGNGRFRDATREAGLHLVGHCQSAHFFDYNNDGFLDLLVTCTANWTRPTLDTKLRYHPGKATYFETAGSEKEYNVLYRNNGKGKFTDVTKATLGRTSWGGMGAYPFDFNNDGKLDLFIVDMHSDMWMPYDTNLSIVQETTKNRFACGPFDETHPLFTKYIKEEQQFADLVKLHYDEVVFGNTFFKNLGNGKFVEMSDRANLETFWPWGIACGDFDNDGYEDVFIPSGMGYPFGYWPNSLMMNQGDESFVNRAVDLGIEPPQAGIYLKEDIGSHKAPRSSRAAAVADFDGDGRLDLIVNNFNGPPFYFRNKGRGGNYVAFRLTGTESNRDAIGAVVRLTTGKETMTRQVNTACGYLAQSSKVIHFGLGNRTRIDKIEITWPSGSRQSVPPPALNALHPLVEPRD